MSTPDQVSKPLRTMAATVLSSEALVLFFASLVAMQLSSVGTVVSLSVGGALAIACLVVVGMLRHRWAYTAGSALQVVVIATGFVVPMMFVLGAIFAVLWVVALRVGRRLVAE